MPITSVGAQLHLPLAARELTLFPPEVDTALLCNARQPELVVAATGKAAYCVRLYLEGELAHFFFLDFLRAALLVGLFWYRGPGLAESLPASMRVMTLFSSSPTS